MHPSSWCYLPIRFTGEGASNVSVKRARKRYFRLNEDGKFVDEVVIRQREQAHAREAEKRKKKGVKRRKGKDTRPNYKTMDSVEYSMLRQGDWYESMDTEEDIEDNRFWCSV